MIGPYLSSMLRQSPDEVLDHAEVLVITNYDPEFVGVLDKLRPKQRVIDFAIISSGDGKGLKDQYEGICW